MVSDVTLSGAAASASVTQQSAVTLAEDFSQFLQLLTTQLQNQDPLSPMDSTEFTNQLVQFSQVEQSINTNTKLDDLVSINLNNAANSALDYVGLDVTYVSAEIAYDGTNDADLRYSLADPAFTSKINIFDEGNNLVLSIDAEKTAGVHEYTWNGKDASGNDMPAGTYIFTVDSFDAEDNKVDTTTVVKGRVKGIETQDGIVYALVGDRAVAVPNILNATEPEESGGA